MADHKAMHSRDRKKGLHRAEQVPAVAQVVEEAWQSELLATPKSEWPLHLVDALTEVSHHSYAQASCEAKQQLERWLLSAIK